MIENTNSPWSPGLASQRTATMPISPVGGAFPPYPQGAPGTVQQMPASLQQQQTSPVYQDQRQQQQQHAIPPLLPGPPSHTAPAFEAFQNYALHVPFMSPATSNQLYMDVTAARREPSIPRPGLTK
ncbi:hypothetical protein GQ54DRAFT_166251 [Martensiomyces pterosporus]|nr:hypothetical protein GQ54DRAFT_166251 [Martensiomyces pterosporus]